MLALENAFLEELLAQLAEDSIVHIADTDTRIMASTQPERIGSNSSTAQYIINIMRTASIANAAPHGGHWQSTYGAPVFYKSQLCGVVVVHGDAEKAALTGDHVRLALEAAMLYHGYIRSENREERKTDEVARLLLSESFDEDKVISLMNQLELDPALLRTVICVRLQYQHPSYFNINLNLGYQSSIEETHLSVLQSVRNNRYLNAQDLVYQLDKNTIVILKGFIAMEDQTRVYLSLDKICQNLEEDLGRYPSLNFQIAYGNLYTRLSESRRSFWEAKNTIELGRMAGIAARTYVLEDVLFESVYQTLPPQLVDKLLLPPAEKLRHRDGRLYREVVDCAQAFVDNCMSIAATSEKTGLHRNTVSTRLEKLRHLTGLNPAESFRDAFITKMLAVYLRQSDSE